MERSSGIVRNQMVHRVNFFDVSKAEKLGWTYKTELEDGIRLSYEDF